MNNEFVIKLINFGLTFHSHDLSLRVQDINISEKKTPIVYQHVLKTWLQENSDNQIGEAEIYSENFNLFAHCKFNYDILISQPRHDHIVLGVPNKRLISFNSMSLLIKKMSLSRPVENVLAPTFIKNAVIENLSIVEVTADPGIFIFQEPVSPSLMMARPDYDPNQAIVFTGPTINKNILI